MKQTLLAHGDKCVAVSFSGVGRVSSQSQDNECEGQPLIFSDTSLAKSLKSFKGSSHPMRIPHLNWRKLVLAAVVGCLTCPLFVSASDEPTLTREQIKQFLLTAKVVKSERAKKGVTETWRLTLSDGTLTHDASFQPIIDYHII